MRLGSLLNLNGSRVLYYVVENLKDSLLFFAFSVFLFWKELEAALARLISNLLTSCNR